MNRRGFLGAILTLGAAPAIAKVENLMRIVVPKTEIITPDKEIIVEEYPILFGDGIRDDTAALQALFSGKPFINMEGYLQIGGILKSGGTHKITETIVIRNDSKSVLVNARIKAGSEFKDGSPLLKIEEAKVGMVGEILQGIYIEGKSDSKVGGIEFKRGK